MDRNKTKDKQMKEELMKNIVLILIAVIFCYMMNSCIGHKNVKVPPGQLKKHTGVHPSKDKPGKGKKK